jgi:hypothetical protein
VTGACATTPRQLLTHAQLIGPAEIPALVVRPSSALDAIVVPASRPAESLETVIDIAKQTGAELVVLCSFRADPSQVQLLLDEKRLAKATVVEVPLDYDHWRFDFDTTRWVREGRGKNVCAVRNSDLSSKRNIGLALAHMLGWKRIFFMDDDIREIGAEAILGTVSLLGANGPGGDRYRSASMAVKAFPDNSVVCHARREIGEYQDVFVSGSMLAVDTNAPFDFFPDIYNEDWLFFYRDAAMERLASSGFQARQLPYDPFVDPLRAVAQEFGDLIAEGLYALLHSNLGAESADGEYWRMFLGDRNRILDEILGNLDKAVAEKRDEMGAAIGAARATLRDITPDMCVHYIDAWRHDLDRWGKRLETLPSAGSIEKALHELELPVIARQEAMSL